MQIETVRIVAEKSDDNDQGFVIINKADFDADKHQLLNGADDDAGQTEVGSSMTAKQLKEALTARGIEFKSNASKADLQALLDAVPSDAK